MNDLDLLIERLRTAADILTDLTYRDIPEREQDRLTNKREGVLLALSYAQEQRRLNAPTT